MDVRELNHLEEACSSESQDSTSPRPQIRKRPGSPATTCVLPQRLLFSGRLTLEVLKVNCKVEVQEPWFLHQTCVEICENMQMV